MKPTIYYTIYRITNKLNGKIYIGSHKTRKLDDGYMGSGKYLKRAIEKHGLENFEREILFVFSTPKEMYAKEAELVNEEFLETQNTYNLKVGGFGGWDYANKAGKAVLIQEQKQRDPGLAGRASNKGNSRRRELLADPVFRKRYSDAMKQVKPQKVSDDEIARAIPLCTSVRHVLRTVGLSVGSSKAKARVKRIARERALKLPESPLTNKRFRPRC